MSSLLPTSDREADAVVCYFGLDKLTGISRRSQKDEKLVQEEKIYIVVNKRKILQL
jgi:hypothetical protein